MFFNANIRVAFYWSFIKALFACETVHLLKQLLSHTGSGSIYRVGRDTGAHSNDHSDSVSNHSLYCNVFRTRFLWEKAFNRGKTDEIH